MFSVIKDLSCMWKSSTASFKLLCRLEDNKVILYRPLVEGFRCTMGYVPMRAYYLNFVKSLHFKSAREMIWLSVVMRSSMSLERSSELFGSNSAYSADHMAARPWSSWPVKYIFLGLYMRHSETITMKLQIMWRILGVPDI